MKWPLVILTLIMLITQVSAQNGESYDITNANGSFTIQVGLYKNTYNGTAYIPTNTSVKNTTYSGYNYMTQGSNYRMYFLRNTNLDQPVRFEKEGYYFIYDVSQGTMTWIGRPGQPAATDTLGSGASSNSLDTVAVVSGSKVTYPTAFYNTNITYEMSGGMAKETFILAGVPSFKTYNWLQYSGNVRFNASLKICTDQQCFIPSGTQDDFETSGRIYFRKANNETVFYLKEPVITDATGKRTIGLYSVHGSNAQMNFWLRINRTWLQNATFPVYIDPTVTTENGTVTIDLSDEAYNPLQQIILDNVTGEGTVFIDTTVLDGYVRYAINPEGLNFSTGHVDVKNASNTHLLKCASWIYDLETCGMNNMGDWQAIASLSPGVYDFSFTNTDPAYSETDADFELSTLNYIEQSSTEQVLLSTKIVRSYIEPFTLANTAAYAVSDVSCNSTLNNVSSVMTYDKIDEKYDYATTLPAGNYTVSITCTGGRLGTTTKTDIIDLVLS